MQSRDLGQMALDVDNVCAQVFLYAGNEHKQTLEARDEFAQVL